MEIPPNNSAVQLFTRGSSNFNPQDITKPILSLKEAEFETSAAAKLLNVEKKTTGSLLDTIA